MIGTQNEMAGIGVIFDMDGTLVDSYEPHRIAWERAAAKDGVSITEALYQKSFGRVNDDITEILWGRKLSPEQNRQIDIEKEAIYREIISTSFPPMPGAFELVATLKASGAKLAIGSSGPKPNVQLCSDKLGITGLLDASISGSDVKHGKPNPEIFLKAALHMGIAPSQCVVVEDSVPGIEAAHAAQMKCITILSTGHFIEEFANADHVIKHLGEITPDLIRRLVGV